MGRQAELKPWTDVQSGYFKVDNSMHIIFCLIFNLRNLKCTFKISKFKYAHWILHIFINTQFTIIDLVNDELRERFF